MLNKNVLMVSLGCDKNLVDSEVMLGLLQEGGYSSTMLEEEADYVVINTCCFIHDSKEESIQTIIEMGELKKKGRLKCIAIAGCLSQRYREEIKKQLPEVDVMVGTTAYKDIVRALKEFDEQGQRVECYHGIDEQPGPQLPRTVTTGGYFAYLKIAEGCDKYCTYCIIPRLRGRYRSIPLEELVKEAEILAGNGAKELILVAQETSLYGTDLYGEKKLPELLGRLCRIEGLRWIRLMYCYPEEITTELIEVIAREPKLCHYLDMPVQHASDAVLKRMGRKTTKEELRKRIRELREAVPDIAIRTSMITGFPGETEAEHEELKDFIAEAKFDRLGVFTYSKEDGTPAARLKEQIKKNVKRRRQSELMLVQQEIAFQKAKSMVGREMEVIIDGWLDEEEVYVGRTRMDAPSVDGDVFVKAKGQKLSGDIINVRITDAREYDLAGEEI